MSRLSGPGVNQSTVGILKAEDDAHVHGDSGVFMLAVRNNDGSVSFTSANGDYSPVAVDVNGRLLVSTGIQYSIGDGSANAGHSFVSNNGSYSSATVYEYLYNGSNWDRKRGAAKFTNVNLGSATAETTIWTPAASKKFRAMGLVLTASVQTVLTFKDNTAGTTILTVELAANVPFWFTLDNGVLSAAANNVLTVTRSVAATLRGIIIGTEE